jgi:nicotinamide mononucleotide (NMN) deamidase PncC
MADCMRLLAHADYAMATTGNLGPAVLEGKPCGLVHIAVSSAERVYSRELHLGGDRAGNKRDASLAALQLLAEAFHEERSYDEHAV